MANPYLGDVPVKENRELLSALLNEAWRRKDMASWCHRPTWSPSEHRARICAIISLWRYMEMSER
jgi:hypothetical protein